MSSRSSEVVWEIILQCIRCGIISSSCWVSALFSLNWIFMQSMACLTSFVSVIKQEKRRGRMSPWFNNHKSNLFYFFVGDCCSGGLFHPGDDSQELAFRYAVEKINRDKTILPRSKLTAQIERIPPNDSFHASKRGKVCTNIEIIHETIYSFRFRVFRL